LRSRLLTSRSHTHTLSFAFDLQLTNTLQKKLDEVRREKSLLEVQIDREKKIHAVLENELSELRSDRRAAAEALEEQDEMEEED
jgi:hypothetical protein